MTASTSPSWVLPSALVAIFGASCGVAGYYVAKEGSNNVLTNLFHSNDISIERCHQLWNQLHDKLSLFCRKYKKAPWWVLLFAAMESPPSPFLYPLLLYAFLAQDNDEDSSHDSSSRLNKMNLDCQHFDETTTQTDALQTEEPRYLEMLVHNVSHTDLVLSVDVPDQQEEDEEYCLCRPRFSAFDLYSKRLLSSLKNPEKDSIIYFPRYERSNQTPPYSIVAPEASRQAMLPTGFQLSESCALPFDELTNLRFRGRDVPRIDAYQQSHQESQLKFNHVFFPLLANLLPTWHVQILKKYNMEDAAKVKKVLILVTGVGTPRNWTHSISGNSTRVCAELMERFIEMLYPDVTVVRIHSETNIFRYDENISFAKRELMPCIDAYRDAHARGEPYPDEAKEAPSDNTNPFSPNWKNSFHVTLSFADGSPARTHAIQAALRGYKPTYFHIWQLKTFWHDTKICDDDLEIHSFQDMEGIPAMESQLVQDKHLQLVIAEMRKYKEDFISSLKTDILKFWLRKTKKPVLAVLLVMRGGEPVLYRGTNMEVSMPTGSLCAERNVIGTALASNPDLKREDLAMVAVLAVPLQSSTTKSSSKPPSDQDEEDWVMQHAPEYCSPVGSPAPTGMTPTKSSPPGTPRKLIRLYSNQDLRKRKDRTVYMNYSKDLNPLRPCGACNEWLKKIAESNPYFQVVTFTDADCAGVYVSPCQE